MRLPDLATAVLWPDKAGATVAITGHSARLDLATACVVARLPCATARIGRSARSESMMVVAESRTVAVEWGTALMELRTAEVGGFGGLWG